MNIVTRRSFLQLSAAAGLAAATAPLSALAATAPAVHPFARAGRPRLRLSLAAYSFRENFPLMRGKPNPKVPPGKATDLFRFADYCAAQGCDGAELTSYFFAEESDDYLLKLRRHCFLRGIAISGTAIGNNFSHPKGPKRDEEIATTKKWIDRAEADKLVITALEECGNYAGQRGVFLGLENHDSIGSAATLLPMVKAVRSPWVGINLDSGNFRTDDPYKDFAECVPYAVNVQFKTEIKGTAPTARPADLKRFTQLLRDGGYQGWVALEYEAKEDAAVAVPRYLHEMRGLFAGG